MAEPHIYTLGRIDGPLLREQRSVLIELANDSRLTTEERIALNGLVELTDVIADQAHDVYGIDCLLIVRPAGGT